ncbi:elongation factor 1-beta [Candidatus Marsarchaeota G1 archaeon OSP_B]|jgi:translation elongation factor aEF-1 beta|uniref:Elongation factor 1-beta n=4 Tax=Candidatus Marsarchaeota group 1 TaxID=2203770 RepID=A0A2R6AKN8_9ARCH|nr:MAG: elongation factor 1-beta [Candidatus Marsarchaeota G1 archaeon OSP_D]PSN86927.1 MAG: elongation factor 1-beta [Candidatus Marsarchaeota G1 archaeon BE_D]PSN89589.1 MAG: elongation factor 1-beta [Candidatus Marsarchaeota G1 archaeon OSP_C]PSN93051.1 MAG: elongation factor 1-beta [Candidatus Marsarchaeota G1 archaeon OSP_B]
MAKGKVVVVAKIYPKDINTDRNMILQLLSLKLNGIAEIKKVEEEPIAFGLVALKLHMVLPEDTEGGTDVIENAASSIELISNVEITHVYRL